MRGTRLASLPLFLIAGSLLIVAYLRYIERRTLFYPMKQIEYLPSQFGLDYEDIFFKTSDKIELNAWFVAAPDPRYTVIFCHGNAGNISHRIEKIKFLQDLGCNTFIFDYRGFGKSKGVPSEKGLYLDVQAAYEYLLSRKIPAEQLVGYGESLGTAVIIDLASKRKLKALILESGFSCARDMAKVAYPFVPYQLFATRWDSLQKIKSVAIPKLLIHSINDEIVPYKLGRKLFDAAPMPKEFLQIRGGHNSGFFESGELLKENIPKFLNRL